MKASSHFIHLTDRAVQVLHTLLSPQENYTENDQMCQYTEHCQDLLIKLYKKF